MNDNSSAPNTLKSNIDWLKGVVNTPPNKQENGFETTKRMNADETYRYEFNRATPGTEFSIPLSTGGSIVGGFHSHPSTGVSMYSFQDMRFLLNLYDNATPSRKHEVFSGLVTKEGEVYILKIEDIDALRKQVDAIWNHPDYASIKDEKKKIDAIHEKQADKFAKSNNPEKSFMEQFPGAGALYKADASVSNFSKLTLSNNTITKTPCN